MVIKMHTKRQRRATKNSGFTYIGLLLFVAIMGVALAAVGEVWQVARQREKERELLFIGNQFRSALNLYAANAPGLGNRYPSTLDNLLKDPRYPGIKRYLRKIYIDPMTGKADWGLVRGTNGEILGVYSRSEDQPLKKANFSKADRQFEGAAKYRDWIFQTGQASPNPGPAGAVTGGSNVRK